MKGIIEKDLKVLKETYKKGTRVELLHMDDPYTKIQVGEKGTVRCVDDIGTIHVNWDCGSSLGVVYGEDSCKIIAASSYTDYCTCFYDEDSREIHFYDEIKDCDISTVKTGSKEEAEAVMKVWAENAPANVICEVLE